MTSIAGRSARKLRSVRRRLHHKATWRTPTVSGQRDDVSFTTFSDSDRDLEALHSLLQRAYQVHLNSGHNFLAATSDVAQLRPRLKGAVCVTAWSDGSLVGTICYRPRLLTSGSSWLGRSGTAKFLLLAVSPDWQGKTLGKDLIAIADGLARYDGATDLALDTPADSWLCDYYARQGFELIETVQWPHASYPSVILSRPLSPAPNWLSIT